MFITLNKAKTFRYSAKSTIHNENKPIYWALLILKSCTLKDTIKKRVPSVYFYFQYSLRQIQKNIAVIYVSVLPMFSSWSFIVSCFTFRSSIHFKFIFVYGVRKCSNFILLHVAVHFSQHHLVKRLSFLHCILLPSFS